MNNYTQNRNDIGAVVVTYNPDVLLLRTCLESISGQVSYVLVIDNASNQIHEIETVCNQFSTVRLQKNEKNLGLPMNYNAATAWAEEMKCDWLLIMDQDSVLPTDYIARAKKFFCDSTIAVICPQYWDTNLESFEAFLNHVPKEESSFVKTCITSGSLCRVETLTELGGFDEKLFIDYVDHDYNRTCLEAGYKILQINNCYMEHQIGKSKKVRMFGRDQITFNHSPIRNYYYFRNRLYFARKHGIKISNEPRFITSYIKRLLLLTYEKNTMKKLFMALRGIHDGFKM